MKGLKNVKAFVDGKFIVTDIAFKDGEITAISNDLPIDEPISVKGTVYPGFIDEHTHGVNNAEAMDGDIKSIDVMSKSLVAEGTTAFLVTTVTDTNERIIKACSLVADYIKNGESGAEVLGVHLEGPFINSSKKGAQLESCIVKPNKDFIDGWIKASNNTIKLITVAPEVENMADFIKYLTSKGITVTAGHTSATFDQLSEGVKNGVSCITHTFNAMSGIHHREIGVAGGSMLLDVYNEIIADGIHVSFGAIRLLASLKADKLILITDAMRAKALPDGTYDLAGQVTYVKNGEVRLEDGTLAGSVLKMNDAVKNMVNKVGLSIETVIKAVTENPAKNLNIFDKYGSISVGKKANFTILDDDFNVTNTIVGGNLVY